MPFNIKEFSFVTYTSHSIFSGNISYINKLVSGGVDNIILYPNTSFIVNKINPTFKGELKISVSPGLAVFNVSDTIHGVSVLVHVFDKYELDLSDQNNYISPDNIFQSCGPNKYINLFLIYDINDEHKVKYLLVNTATEDLYNYIYSKLALWIATIQISNDCENGDFIPAGGINMKYTTVPIIYKRGEDILEYSFKRTLGTTITYPTLYDVNGGIVYRNDENQIVWGDYIQ